MKQIQDLINTIGMNNIIIIAAILIALLVCLIVYRSLRLKVFRQEIVEIENHINGIKTLPIQYRLGRVQSIAKNMKEVEEDYEEFSKDYEDLVDFEKNELGVLVNEVDEKLYYSKIRGINKKMQQLRLLSKEYDERSHDLLKRIEKVTEIENVQRVEIIRVKEKYRVVGGHYEDIRMSIESFVPEVNDIFSGIDEDFVRLEGMMNNQLFEDAKAFTTQIEGRIDRLDDNMKDLPSYVSVVKQVLPDRIDALDKLIDSLEEDAYALDKMEANIRYNTIVDGLEEAVQYVKDVEIEDAGKKLESLTNDIELLETDLKDEQASFKQFKDSWKVLTDQIDVLSQDYDSCMADYNQLTSLYIIDEDDVKIEAQHKEFEEYKSEYEFLKENLETTEFAYKDMLERVDILIESTKKHEEYIKTFVKQRDTLYHLEDKAIHEIENMNIVLLEVKSEIKNNHLPMINESYKYYIEDSYEKARDIQKLREVRPLMVEELVKKVEGARDVIYKLYDNVHHLIVTAEMVEEAIIFGNRYRSTYLEVNTELTKAEVLYRNGEYTKALSTAVDIIERIQPGSYEKLLKTQENA